MRLNCLERRRLLSTLSIRKTTHGKLRANKNRVLRKSGAFKAYPCHADKALPRPLKRVLRPRNGPGAASLRRAYFWRLLKEKSAAKSDKFDGECGGGRRPMGRRRQGQDRRLAVARGRHRGAFSGRPQCRAYARHRQQCL